MKKLALVLAMVMALLCVFTACGEEKSGGLTITADNTAASDTQIMSGLIDSESYTLSKNITKIVLTGGPAAGKTKPSSCARSTALPKAMAKVESDRAAAVSRTKEKAVRNSVPPFVWSV